jgi:hypothetical protein
MREKCRHRYSLVVIQSLFVVRGLPFRRERGRRKETYPAPRRTQSYAIADFGAWCLLSLSKLASFKIRVNHFHLSVGTKPPTGGAHPSGSTSAGLRRWVGKHVPQSTFVIPSDLDPSVLIPTLSHRTYTFPPHLSPKPFIFSSSAEHLRK